MIINLFAFRLAAVVTLFAGDQCSFRLQTKCYERALINTGRIRRKSSRATWRGIQRLMNSATPRFVLLDLDKRQIACPIDRYTDPGADDARAEQSHGNLNKVNLLRVCLPDGGHWTAARGRRLVFSQNSGEKRGFRDIYKYKCRFNMYMYPPSLFAVYAHTYPHGYVHFPSDGCIVSAAFYLLLPGFYFSLLDDAWRLRREEFE